MNDVISRGREAVNPTAFSRRGFLARTSYFGALYATARLFPMSALAGESPANSPASADIGNSLAVAYNAPKYDVLARKPRRENAVGLTASRPRLITSFMEPP